MQDNKTAESHTEVGRSGEYPFSQDLNPNYLAGDNYGERDPDPDFGSSTAYDVKGAHNALEDWEDDDLKQVPILPVGTRLQQGATYLDLGRYEEARNMLSVYLERRPYDAEGLYHYGQVLEKLGEPAEARETYARSIEAARTAVWRAIQAVGGIASPAGSCLWHVLGWERSLKEWALQQGWSGRRVSQESASGILIAGLGALESHFGIALKFGQTHFHVDKSGSM